MVSELSSKSLLPRKDMANIFADVHIHNNFCLECDEKLKKLMEGNTTNINGNNIFLFGQFLIYHTFQVSCYWSVHSSKSTCHLAFKCFHGTRVFFFTHPNSIILGQYIHLLQVYKSHTCHLTLTEFSWSIDYVKFMIMSLSQKSIVCIDFAMQVSAKQFNLIGLDFIFYCLHRYCRLQMRHLNEFMHTLYFFPFSWLQFLAHLT